MMNLSQWSTLVRVIVGWLHHVGATDTHAVFMVYLYGDVFLCVSSHCTPVHT